MAINEDIVELWRQMTLKIDFRIFLFYMLESEETSKEKHEETQQKPQPGRQEAPSESRGACGTSADEIPGKLVSEMGNIYQAG